LQRASAFISRIWQSKGRRIQLKERAPLIQLIQLKEQAHSTQRASTFNSFNSKSKHIQLKEQAHSTHSTQRGSTFNLKSKHIQLIQLKEQAQLIQLKEQAPAAQPSPARLMGRCQCRRAHMLH
jgi:hypothetical protein